MATIGIPIAGTIDTAGTAYLQTIPTETFTWTNAHAAFAGDVSLNDFKKAFVLSESLIDASASLLVSMDVSGATAFKAALVKMLSGASGFAKFVAASGADPGGYLKDAMVDASSNLQSYLESYAQAQIDADLAANTIPAGFEAEHVYNLALTNFATAVSTGVDNLWNAMVAANNTNTLNIIARQIPRSRYGETFDSSLLVLANDVITFRFNINQTYGVLENQAALTAAAGTGATGANGASALVSYPGVGANYGIGARAIDIKIKLV